MTNLIGILGDQDEIEVKSLILALERIGEDYFIWDTSKFPEKQSIGYQCDTGDFQINLSENKEIAASQVYRIFWRTFLPPVLSQPNPEESSIAHSECYGLLFTLLHALGQKVFNPAEAIMFHKRKPEQLSRVSKIGVPIPKTYVGNQLFEVKKFVNATKKAIFKPVVGGNYAQIIEPGHLIQAHMETALAKAPITLQAFIEGDNIRTYCIGSTLFSACIDSNEGDFRLDQNACIQPIETPEPVGLMALNICKALGLKWSAIDWRRDYSGTYYFLEANPSPMFARFEQETGYPISNTLATYLSNSK